MAKRIVDEEMRFTVIVNGNDAQKELFDLEKSTRRYTQENKDLKSARAKLSAQGKQDSIEYKRYSQKIKENSAVLSQNRHRMEALEKQIGVTNLSMTQLARKAAHLRLQLKNMDPEGAQFTKLNSELKTINARMAKLKMTSQAAEGSLSRLANKFNKYQALALGFAAAIAGVAVAMQGWLDYSGLMSDAQSDVQKTTGLTKQEVDKLTRSFGALKTRTARIELLELATEAGRLGIEGTENIRLFTEQANKMKVALGDDLSVEQIREVGKIAKIYEVGTATGKDFAGSMDALGSAINEVSASGANQAGFLVNYLSRQAGIAKQAKLSAADNIGYAATFDEIGQKVEVSATAMNKIFIDLFSNPSEYAKIAGVELDKFNTLLSEDSNEAMILFLEGLNGNSEGLGVMVERMESLNVGGTRGVQALTAMAASTDTLRKRQKLANDAIQEATSLTDEYNLKNNNLAATLKKVQRTIIGTFTSQKIIKGLTGFIDWFAKFIGASDDATGRITKFRNRLIFFLKALIVVGSAILSNVVYLKLLALWTNRASTSSIIYTTTLKLQVLATELAFAATQLYAAATMFLTGNIRGAIQAIRILSATMKTTPWGLVLGLVTAVATAYFVFSENAEKAESAQLYLNKASIDARKNTAAQAVSLETLMKIARDETATKEARLKAIEALNIAVPEYNGYLTLETANTKKADAILKKYIESIERHAEVEFFRQLVAKKATAVIEAEGSSLEDNIEWYEQLWNGVKAGGSVMGAMNKNLQTSVKNKLSLVAATKEELQIAKDLLEQRLKENPELINNLGIVPPDDDNDPDDLDPDDPVKPKGRDIVGEAQAANKQLLSAQRAAQDARIALMEDGYLRQHAKLKIANDRKLEDLAAQKVAESEIEMLQGDIDSALVKGKAKEAVALEQIKLDWIARNQELDNQMSTESALYIFKQGEMVNAGYEAQIADLEAGFERKKVARRIAYLDALEAMGDNNEAKLVLQNQFDQDEIALQEAHLIELARQMKLVIDQGDFGGFDLELLTPDQHQEMLDMLEELRLKLAELNNEKADLTQGNSDGDFTGLGAGDKTDILGTTIDEWQKIFDNLDTTEGKLKLVTAGVQGFQQAWSMYYEFVNANENRRFKQFAVTNDKSKAKLKKRLDTGLINQRQYDQGVTALDEQMDKRKADLEYRQAQRSWKMQLANALVGAAMATINGLNSVPFLPTGLIMGGLAASMGLLQVGVISKNKPVKGYESGYGYDNIHVERSQDGKKFDADFGGNSRSGFVDKPTVFLAGEQGELFPELIVSGPDLKRFNPEVTQSVRNELARVKGYAGGYVGEAMRGGDVSSDVSDLSEMYALALNRNSDILERLLQDGVQALLAEDMETFKRIKKGVARYDSLRIKSQI